MCIYVTLINLDIDTDNYVRIDGKVVCNIICISLLWINFTDDLSV